MLKIQCSIESQFKRKCDVRCPSIPGSKMCVVFFHTLEKRGREERVKGLVITGSMSWNCQHCLLILVSYSGYSPDEGELYLIDIQFCPLIPLSPCPRSAAWLMVLRLQTDLVPGSVIYHGLWTLQTLPVTSHSISSSSSQRKFTNYKNTVLYHQRKVSCDWKDDCKRLIIEVLPSIFMPFMLWPIPNSNLSPQWSALTYWGSAVELSTNLREVFTVPGESPYKSLILVESAFTIGSLLRHYDKGAFKYGELWNWDAKAKDITI